MSTIAKLSADGKHYMMNGDKLWCTNVSDPKTTLIAVLARTPDKVLPNGRKLPQISCFVVETAWPGVERVRRSRFMGCAASPTASSHSRTSRCPPKT